MPSEPKAVSSGACRRSTDGQTMPIRSGGRAAADQLEDLLADELQRAARAGALEEANRALDRRRGRRRVGEQRPLDVRDRRMSDVVERGRELLDALPGERGQLLGGGSQRSEGRAARLVRKGHGHVGAAGERLDEAPLGLGQVLEAVGEDGLPLPRLEVTLELVDGVGAKEIAVPEATPVELLAIGGVQAAEVALDVSGLDERGAELAHRVAQRLDEAGRARRGGEAVQGGLCGGAAEQERLLDVGGERPCAAAADPAKEIVEGADRSPDKAAPPGHQLPLDPLDVRPDRHDQIRVAIQSGHIALEEQRNLAGVRRPGDQREGHLPIVRTPSDGA